MTTTSLRSLSRAVLAAFLLTPVLALAQSSTVQVPSRLKAVDPALKGAADSAHAAWKQDEGKDLGAGLTYVDGVPNLMLITSRSETPAALLKRQRTIIAACDFLLDDAAFAKLVITVVAMDPKTQTTSSVEILRGNFKEAVQDSAKSANAKADAKAAAREAKETDSVLKSVSAKLGLK